MAALMMQTQLIIETVTTLCKSLSMLVLDMLDMRMLIAQKRRISYLPNFAVSETKQLSQLPA